ncbi:MAG: N-(5-phosphoribosyl)anthranilate isomerase [Actinomycetota bacterium]|jgi:phosphoribosylanthranilate isomerase
MFIKICGITNEQDALLAVALGADALGFVFAPSPRQISPALAREIVKRLPPETVTVGVFRNEIPARIIEIVNEARLQGAQLHGHETPAMTAEVATDIRFVIKAVVAGSPDAAHANNFASDAILVDGLHPGSGTAYDWELLQDIPTDIRLMLSGGLTPENVAAGIAQVRPWGVDVSSGVEKAPGLKDAVKMRHFITNARDAVLG